MSICWLRIINALEYVVYVFVKHDSGRQRGFSGKHIGSGVERGGTDLEFPLIVTL